MVIPLRTFSLLRNRSGVVPDVFIVDRTVREWTMDWSGLLIFRFLLVSFYHLEGIQDLQDKEKLIIDVYPEIPRKLKTGSTIPEEREGKQSTTYDSLPM